MTARRPSLSTRWRALSHATAPAQRNELKRAGWRRHGILIIAERNPRLGWSERELVRQLGARLCDRRPEPGR
jgi:hypothetical protein